MLRPYDLALRFVGIHELPGEADEPFVMRMLRLDTSWPERDEVPWCSAFMNFVCWCLRLPRSKSLSARSWLNVGVPVDLEDAQVGYDVVVFWRKKKSSWQGHVGLYAGQQGNQVLVLGGNQKNAVTIEGKLKSRVLGVRRLYNDLDRVA